MSGKRKPPQYLGVIRDPALIARLMSRVTVDEDGCWVWTGHCDKKGYGQCWWGDRAHWAHRLSYAAFNGPIPSGMTIHHKCFKHGCIHPDHLDTATIRENASEGSRRYHEGNTSQKCAPDHTGGDADDEAGGTCPT